MFKKFLSFFRDKAPAYALYGTLVDAARQPRFYTDFGVDDSLDGRFDMILLHLFILLHRLESSEKDMGYLLRDVQEALFADMDRSLREMGVGDMMVGKQVKAMGVSWFGRKEFYGSALASDDPDGAMVAALERNVYRGGGGASQSLKNYVFMAIKNLAAVSDDAISENNFSFGDAQDVSLDQTKGAKS